MATELATAEQIVPPKDMSIIKMENDMLISAAATASARNIVEITDSLKHQITAFPAFAEDAMYCLVVGTDPKTKTQELAEDLSVRMAETIRSEWKYNRVDELVEVIDNDNVKVTGVFTDFLSAIVTRRERIVCKTWTDRKGTPRRHSDDKFHSKIVPGQLSRVIREAVLRSLPASMRTELLSHIRATLSDTLTEGKVTQIIAGFSRINVTEEDIVKYLGKERSQWNEDDRVTLHGVFASINSGQSSVESEFHAESPADPPPPEKSKADDIADQLEKTDGGTIKKSPF